MSVPQLAAVLERRVGNRRHRPPASGGVSWPAPPAIKTHLTAGRADLHLSVGIGVPAARCGRSTIRRRCCFYRGELPPPAWPLIAVVGTRQPTGHGRDTAYAFALELGPLRDPHRFRLWRVGIDLEAHRGSLAGWRWERCATVAVLGCGIDRIYPYSSREVAREVVRRGCLVSEFPPGAAAYPHHFPLRNRIIAGFSRAVLVVEAPARSGALITAACAADEGREVLVSADVLGSSRAAGCAALAAAGAPPVDGAGALLAEVGLAAPGAPPPAAAQGRCEVPRHQRAAGAWLAGRFALERERQIVVNDWSIEDRM